MKRISEYVARLQTATGPVNPEYYGVYPASVRSKETYTVFMGRVKGKGILQKTLSEESVFLNPQMLQNRLQT